MTELFVRLVEGALPATTVLILLYALLCIIHASFSLNALKKAKNELTSGKLKKFMGSLYITITLGFIYGLWNILMSIEVFQIGPDLLRLIISNLVVISFLMYMTYLAFLAKDLGDEFGFRVMGKKISEYVKDKKRKT